MTYSSPHVDGPGRGVEGVQFRTGLCSQKREQHNLAATHPRLQRSGGKYDDQDGKYLSKQHKSMGPEGMHL